MFSLFLKQMVLKLEDGGLILVCTKNNSKLLLLISTLPSHILDEPLPVIVNSEIIHW